MEKYIRYIETSSTYKSQITTILADADNLISGDFTFNCVWDMEPCDKKVSNPGLKWNMTYDEDIEWSYMFTRFDFSYKLIIAYEIKKDFKYINYGLNFIRSWYRNNWLFLEGNVGKIYERFFSHENYAHRTLDVSILASNIADYLIYCKKNQLLTDKEIDSYRKVIKKIARYVYDSDREFKTKTNWGPIENGNVYYAAKILNITIPYSEVFTRLKNQLDIQIFSDGSHCESSPMYLVEVLLSAMRCYQVCTGQEQLLLREKIKLCCDYLYAVVMPNGCIPNIGDSDLINISDIMIIASQILNDPKYLDVVTRNISCEYIYRYGVEPLEDFQEISQLLFTQHGMLQLENQVLYKDPKQQMYLLCSNIPKGPSGHKHYDYFSLILARNGKEILIDAGRETYKNGCSRKVSKSPMSHNSFVVNGEEFWEAKNAWTTIDRVSTNSCKSYDNQRIIMNCRFGDMIDATRVVTPIEGIGIIITDIISGEEYEEYDAFFNFSALTQVSNNETYITINNQGEILYYFNDTQEPITIKKGRGSIRYNTHFDYCYLDIKSRRKTISHFFLYKLMDIKCIFNEGTLTYVNSSTGNVMEFCIR